MNKLNICKATRKIAADSLYIVLKKLLSSDKQISEIDLRDAWLFELRKHKEIFPDGWYTPPPHGISILFSTEDKLERINFKSFRWKKYWPTASSFLDKEKGFLIAYASVVNKKSGIIGDFGLTLYFGKNPVIEKHFREILNSQKQIFSYTTIGMNFKKLYGFADIVFKKMGLSNNWWINKTDPSGENIGHTIPGIFEGWNKKEKELLQNGKTKWQEIADMISKKRIFISPAQNFTIQPGVAFSIEHRLKSSKNLPLVWFHTIALFKENSKKELLTNFDKIFKLVGMDYML